MDCSNDEYSLLLVCEIEWELDFGLSFSWCLFQLRDCVGCKLWLCLPGQALCGQAERTLKHVRSTISICSQALDEGHGADPCLGVALAAAEALTELQSAAILL